MKFLNDLLTDIPSPPVRLDGGRRDYLRRKAEPVSASSGGSESSEDDLVRLRRQVSELQLTLEQARQSTERTSTPTPSGESTPELQLQGSSDEDIAPPPYVAPEPPQPPPRRVQPQPLPRLLLRRQQQPQQPPPTPQNLQNRPLAEQMKDLLG